VHTLQVLAEMCRVDAVELAAQIDANATACFGL
jgi:Tat protein secretion system quality control protein TatD with DNase activity